MSFCVDSCLSTPAGEMGREEEFQVVVLVIPDCRHRCLWIGISAGSHGNDGRAGGSPRDAHSSRILSGEAESEADGQTRAASPGFPPLLLCQALRWAKATQWSCKKSVKGRWVVWAGLTKTLWLPLNLESHLAWRQPRPQRADGPNVRRPRPCCAMTRLAQTSPSLCGHHRPGPTSLSEGPGGRGRPASAAQRKKAGLRLSTVAVRMLRLRASVNEVSLS